ncbi:hypothetical protein [Peribacillus loiseleuriae]|uniref:Uncharacterized protein n=1 Tax=Peribacillus loiseleuriae TaxID=1679170 RepID=A0A0K9GTI1_9BACI|nr:hypothetical protein [Peribacillus loiseleuriae]KMY49577.1 hypothetical protein AC625_08490 [Peribacillus loiseleuriae]
MPKPLSKMRIPDPFVMNEDTVNISVWEFLKHKEFDSPSPLKGKQRGIDVQGEKFGWEIYVESKGSHGNDHDGDTVFGQGQIKVHTYNQIGKLMEYKSNSSEKSMYVMANPDIPRIRKRVQKVANSLDLLGFIRFWVQDDKSIIIEFPEHLEDRLRWLGLIEQ